MEQRRHIAVIGAGIVGVATAIWLQRDGHRVTLIDREGPAAGASHGNGGVLASAGIVPVTGPGLLAKAPRMLFDRDGPLWLKWQQLPRLLPWLIRYLGHCSEAETRRIAAALAGVTADSLAEHQALAIGTGAGRWIVPCDFTYLYRNRAAFEADALGWSLREEHGHKVKVLEGPALRAYDPNLGPSIGLAAAMPGHGRITDPGAYVHALVEDFLANDGQFRQAEIDDVTVEQGRLTGLLTQGETIACDAAVVATGAWSGPLARRLGIRAPLESERGYHLELWGASAMPRTTVLLAKEKFVATPMEGRLRLAGQVEFGGLQAPASRAPFRLFRKAIREALPGITWEREVEWLGHRPSLSDSIPVIGEVPGIAGAFLGFGHHHVGLTCGPRTGRLLAQLVAGRTPNQDLSAYAPARFA
ncbi:MAG: FAD-binding oxidoreductase [Pseudomonadota bacterium]